MTGDAATADVEPVARPRRYVAGRGWESRVPRVLSWLCYGLAAFVFITTIFRLGGPWLRNVRLGIEMFFVPAPPNLAWGVLLAILASALGKRKRAAWRLLFVIALLKLAFWVLGWIYVPDVVYPVVLVPLAMVAILLTVMLLSHREFFAIVQKGNGLRALLTFVIGAVGSFGLGYLIITTFAGSIDRVERTPFVLSQLTFNPHLHGPRLVQSVIGILGSVTIIATAYVFFKVRRHDLLLSQQQEVAVRGLLREYGDRDSLGYFATRRDRSVIFSPSGKAAVSYRVITGVSLAGADPVGDPEAWPAAIEAWLEEAGHYAWAPAVMGASKLGAQAYRRAGLSAIELGDEAIVRFGDFTLEGRHMRVVRQAVNRVERAGYTARVRRHGDIPPEEMAEIIAAADDWRDTENERGFSMALGRLGDPADARCVLAEAFDSSGQRQALMSFSPWGERGLSLDLMRRSRDSENGVMEFMVATLIEAGPRIGADRVSLNFAVMRGVFEEGGRIGAGPVIRATRAFLLFASRWWQLESLYRANAKYAPDWVPRYLLFENPGDLLRVGVASGIAEGFIPEPSLKQWWRDRKGPDVSPFVRDSANSPAELLLAEQALLDESQARAAAELEAAPHAHLPEQEQVRREKLASLRATGVDPYATVFARTSPIGEVRAAHAGLGPDIRTGIEVSIAGRVMLNRVAGKLCFATVRDWTGDIQVMLSLADSGQQALDAWKSFVDLGDIVGVTGEVITSKRGELSVMTAEFAITSKCLVPLPDKYKGLSDPEARVRQRYVDLIVNPETRDLMRIRTAMVRSVRESLWRRSFAEVETPMLQRVHGGANARPFVTHINAYDMRLYLRIAPELYLKRLLVGGAEKVFELNRNFRNEGADATHNPEFTMLEMYDAYGNYETMRALTRELIIEAAIAVHGAPIARRPLPDGTYEEVDISGEWPVIAVHEAISQAVGQDVTPETGLDVLAGICERHGIARDHAWGTGLIILELYEHFCESRTTMPVFYKDFPTEVSPLTRQMPANPKLAERWDLVAWGAEIGTAYTELIDPIEQRHRLTAQSLLAAAGDAEAMEIDEDFLRALEYGMPPAGGQGMGIDRLFMMLTGRNIRESILFPLTRPDGHEGQPAA